MRPDLGWRSIEALRAGLKRRDEGEHGIGLGKGEFLVEACEAAVDVMRKGKQALDPLGILDPGKVLERRP